MTSYLSSLTTHYNHIKRLLPTHLSPDADNSISDQEDSHVSRVLRAYYTEKGRPFPAWLGPDPNAPLRPQPQYVSQSRPGSSAAPPASSVPSRRGGGLGDLFGESPPPAAAPQQEEPLSLRSRRGAAFKAQTPAAAAQVSQASQPMARPLPSQRQGSYQSRGSDSGSFGAPIVKEQTAQERLRARLGGARGTSPAAAPAPSTSFDSRGGNGSSYNPYESGGGGSAFNPYESGGSGGGGFNPYDNGSKNPYTSSGSSQRPYASSSSLWSTGDDPGDLGGGAGRRGPGLPSNPRSRR